MEGVLTTQINWIAVLRDIDKWELKWKKEKTVPSETVLSCYLLQAKKLICS